MGFGNRGLEYGTKAPFPSDLMKDRDSKKTVVVFPVFTGRQINPDFEAENSSIIRCENHSRASLSMESGLETANLFLIMEAL
jgi:hypothetical protein